jgi:hypothetical protein
MKILLGSLVARVDRWTLVDALDGRRLERRAV